MTLHPDQLKQVNEIAEATKRYRYILAQRPTGGGKTVMFSGICDRYLKANPTRSALVLVHRIELLKQTRLTMWNAFKLSCQPITAGMKYIPPAPVYVGMVESTHTRLPQLENIGLAIIDECHEGIFNKIHDSLKKRYPGIIIVGFSATPLATQRKFPLNSFYQTIITGPQIKELIELGTKTENEGLVQNITYAPKDVVDRLALTVKGSDFDSHFMGEQYKKPRYVNNTVKAYIDKADGKKAIVFNVNVLHSITVCDAFNKAGYNAKHIDGKTPKKLREEILLWFKETEGAILCNCDIARTGFDEPSIECVIVNLSTMSMVKWLQMGGRGGRRFSLYVNEDGKLVLVYKKDHFIIIDMGGNAHTHKDWNENRDWKDIFENPPKPSKGGGVAPTKTCPGFDKIRNQDCEVVLPAGARLCPFCGHKFDEKEIALEVDLHDFIIMTKGINIEAIINKTAHGKEYYPLFYLGRQIALQASKTIAEMTDERAIFIAAEYEKRAKEWYEKHNENREKASQIKQVYLPRRVFAAVMKERCKEVLYTELKQLFPLWKTTLIKTNEPPPQEPAKSLENGSEFKTIESIQDLKNLHYEL